MGALLFPLVPGAVTVFPYGYGATGRLDLLDGTSASLGDGDVDGAVDPALAEQPVVAHLAEVYGVTLSELLHLLQVDRDVHVAQAGVSVEAVHSPVPGHVLQSRHQPVLVDSRVATTASLAGPSTGLLATAVIAAATSELVRS